MNKYDVIIIGAGAAGMAAAGAAIAQGRQVAILEMGKQIARKVMVSGGGRCNFTNTAVAYNRYFGQNPEFVRGAISRVSPNDILNWAQTHGIQFTEKTPGQYFTQNGASEIITALIQDSTGAKIITECTVKDIDKTDGKFVLRTTRGNFTAQSVIIATGGTSFPTLGVSDAGMRWAKKLGHKIVPIRPGLCAMAVPNFSPDLAGIAIDAEIKIGRNVVQDSLLFTHFGIGGPATYRASLYDLSNGIHINLMPGINVGEWLCKQKQSNGRKVISNIIGDKLPGRLAKHILGDETRRIADIKNSELNQIAVKISDIFIPGDKINLHGMQSAEVIRGGVSTQEISSKTMESKICPGLFFAGEVMDIAGDLGGFNLHWAWASGRIAGQNA